MIAIICCGISASGKSTYADKWLSENTNCMEINRDNIRRKLTLQSGKEWKWSNWNWSRESEVTEICNEDILFAANCGFDIIISDTNLNSSRRNKMFSDLMDIGYEVSIKAFPIELEEAIKRDSLRDNPVGESVIKRQYDQWKESFDVKSNPKTSSR